MNRNFYAGLAASALILVAGAPGAHAQAGQATLSGTITDPTGAIIPGAKATLIDEATKVQRTVIADKNGIVTFVAVPPSTYDVLVSSTGFKPTRENGIAVHINDQLDLRNIVLNISAGDVSVTVTSESGDITPTTSGEQAYTLTDKQIQNLNIESRSAIELLDLIPGAANTGNFTGTYNRQQAGFGQNASTYTVNGNRFDQVQIVSDGAPVTDLNTAGAAAVTPNVDMISEAKVETSAFSAVQPNGPIVFNTQTKSGGDHYHGEAYLQARNHIFDATDSRVKDAGLPKPQSSFYYSGFNIGGPVVIPHSNFNHNHDKLFFFAATEITQQHVDLGLQDAITPTAAMRTGDFSDTGYISSLSDYAVNTNPCVKEPGDCSSTAGIINPGLIDPGGKILLNAIPLPNADPTKNGGYNYVTDLVTSDPRNQENLKIDYALNEKTHLSARFNHENENVPAPYGPYNTVNFNRTVYPAAQTGRNASNSLVFNLTRTFSPTLTNELNVSYTRFSQRIDVTNLAAVSLTGTNYPYPDLFPGVNVLPNLSFDGGVGGGLYIPGGEVPPYTGVQNTTTINDGFTKLLHKHQLQFGFYDVYESYNNRTALNDNGTVSLGTYIPESTNNEYADLLLGNIAGYAQTSPNVAATLANKRFDLFAEDTWKATSRLTVNYGARLDHIAWWYDKDGHIVVFNPNDYVASSAPNAYTGLETHATNPSVPVSGSPGLSFQFAPSVGFAYDLNGHGSTILRGGFGTNYYVDPGINALSALDAPPNIQIFSQYNTNTSYQNLTLQNASQENLATIPATVYGTASTTDHSPAVTYSWNLALAKTLPQALKVEASYVGNTTRHLNGYAVLNAVPLGAEQGPYYGSYYDMMYRPYKNYTEIDTHEHNLNSNYNSLQVTASRSKGSYNFWLTYTYGKAMAYNCEDTFNERNCYNPAPFDRSQALNVSYYIILPRVSEKYLGNHRAVNGALDGWQISGIEQYGSGTPFSDIATQSALNNEYGGTQVIGIYGDYNPTTFTTLNLGNAAITGTPDELAEPNVICNPAKGLKAHQYFNPACFTAPTQFHNGTFHLPYIHGPASFNDEIGVFKDFKIREASKLQIRFQGFNFLNRPQDEFLQYDSHLYMGFGATGATTPDNLSTAGFTTNRTGHRTVQLEAKYYF